MRTNRCASKNSTRADGLRKASKGFFGKKGNYTSEIFCEKKVSISGGWFAIFRALHANLYFIHSAAKGISDTSNVQFSEGFSISVVDAIDGDEANATDRS